MNDRFVWAKTQRARIAHLYAVCDSCQGRGWLIGERGGLFGLAWELEPCVKCGGLEGEYENWPSGGMGYVVLCGYFSVTEQPVELAPEAERCIRCLERAE